MLPCGGCRAGARKHRQHTAQGVADGPEEDLQGHDVVDATELLAALLQGGRDRDARHGGDEEVGATQVEEKGATKEA